MNKMFTTAGVFIQPNIDSSMQTGPSISREEQLRRLSCLKKVKGMRESAQNRLGESVFD